MGLDRHNHSAQSYLGAFLSLLILVSTSAYAVQKLDILLAKKDVDVLAAVKDLAFTSDFKFTYINGLNIAVAFTEYNDNTLWELPKEYGKLIINSYTWG